MKNWMFALFGLALLVVGFAASNASTSVLELKYEIMSCRVNAIASLVSYGENNTNLSSNGLAEKLADDLITLQTYVNNNDRQGFNDFVRGMLKEDLKDSILYLRDVRREFVKGRNGEAVREYFEQVKKERATCIQNAALSFAQTHEDEIEERVNNMGKVIEKLKNKSVNTTELEEIYAEAQSNLDKFKAAVATGNGSEVFETVKEIREQHLHIWARFHIEKLREVLNVVSDEATNKGYGSDVDAINSLLNDASSKVVVGRPYNPGEFEQVKEDLKQASQKLRDLIKKIRGV